MDKKYDLDTVIQQVKTQNTELLEKLNEEIKTYPRGSLVKRVVSGRNYCYFRYRDGKKIITKYAGTEAKYDELKAIVEKRDEAVAQVKSINAEMLKIKKIEAIK